MKADEFEIVDPRADSMVESLRAFGYSLPNAVADIVDNSITARASEVAIQMTWNGPDSWIEIKDNGCGMNEKRLVEAMRPGGQSPLEHRDLGDLGRFGLGLKTASFSQCRCLNVRSRQKNEPEATRCWDLDLIGKEKKWVLLKRAASSNADEILGHFDKNETGTVVLWQSLDKIVGEEEVGNRKAHDRFDRRVAQVEEYLGTVFHRYLAGKPPFAISVNGTPIEPWDPFLTNHPATQHQPVEPFGDADKLVTVRPFVLPHQSKLSPEEFRIAGGTKGWGGQQGFYVYRNRRLIVDGGWLGFYQQEEHYKLARIQIDITNASDAEWKIDVRKAQASPPDNIREDIKRIASATRNHASEIYRHRGSKMRPDGDPSHPQIYVWESVKKRDKTCYRINREHPLIKQFLEAPDDKTAKTVLKLVEETIPIPYIIANFSSNIEQHSMPFEDAGTSLVRDQLIAVAVALRRKGLSEDEIRKKLLYIDPFQLYPELVASFSFDEIEKLARTRSA